MEVVAGRGQLRKEFDGLVTEVFGSEGIHVGYNVRLDIMLDRIDWYLVKPVNEPIFFGLITYPRDELQAIISPDVSSCPRPEIFEDGVYRDIKIGVYHPDAMKVSERFGERYQALSGKNVKIIREF